MFGTLICVLNPKPLLGHGNVHRQKTKSVIPGSVGVFVKVVGLQVSSGILMTLFFMSVCSRGSAKGGEETEVSELSTVIFAIGFIFQFIW